MFIKFSHLIQTSGIQLPSFPVRRPDLVIITKKKENQPNRGNEDKYRDLAIQLLKNHGT